MGFGPFFASMRITLSARSKVLQLSSLGQPFRISVMGSLIAGSLVNLERNAIQTPLDVTINVMPMIIADIASVNYLEDKTVDFDYNTQEFIISNRGNEH